MAVQRDDYNKNNQYQKQALEQLNAQYGKLPPQAPEVEKAVLGALMLERDAFMSVADMLKPQSFYKEEHQKIFKVIQNLNQAEKPVDLLMVTQLLRDRGELEAVGGPGYIAELTSNVSAAAHIQTHARTIAAKAIQRDLIRASSHIQSKSYQDNIELNDLIDFAESQLFGVTEGNISKETVPIKPVLLQALEQIEINSQKPEGMTGVPSGFTALDRMTSGWQNSDLLIVAARPAMGKTAFVLSMARNITIEHKIPVAFFSLEMSSLQLVNRLIASETELGSEKIKTGKLAEHEWVQLHERIKNLNDAPLFIDDTPALSIYEFRAKCRRLKMQHNIGCVIVDYLQLMTVGNDSKFSREQEVSTISRNLKAIAKEINVPILALSQLSRAVESRAGNKPQLSDLRESGAIEQDADMVMFIHRPEYYGIDQDEQGNSLKGVAEIVVAKHRNGSVGDVQLAFKSHMARFGNLDDDDFGDGYDNIMSNASEGAAAGQTFGSKMNTQADAPAKGAAPDPNKGGHGSFDFPIGTGFDDDTPF